MQHRKADFSEITWPEFKDGRYQSPQKPIGWFARSFPSLTFYFQFLMVIIRSVLVARRGGYDNQRWIQDSLSMLRHLEGVGVQFEIEGAEHFLKLTEPCLFIGNHMSTLETVVLPGLIQPYRDVTFVAKSSLAKYPAFKHVIGSRDPILVDRTNPREDLGIILKEGRDRIERGFSVIIFPQSTRRVSFEPKKFNKVGVKLAVRSKAPIVPIALKTDAWGTGKYVSDLGRIDRSKRVRIAFGPPITVQGRGHSEHQAICDFINEKLESWHAGSGTS